MHLIYNLKMFYKYEYTDLGVGGVLYQTNVLVFGLKIVLS